MTQKRKEKRMNQTLTFSLDEDLRKWIESQSKAQKRSISNFIRVILEAKRKEAEQSKN